MKSLRGRSAIGGSTKADRCSSVGRPSFAISAQEGRGVPVRRIGLEQEFFLVDRTGAPCDLADPFLWRCRQAAESGGLDPRCFKEECVKSLVEVTTPPSADLAELTRNYLANLALALEVGAE